MGMNNTQGMSGQPSQPNGMNSAGWMISDAPKQQFGPGSEFWPKLITALDSGQSQDPAQKASGIMSLLSILGI